MPSAPVQISTSLANHASARLAVLAGHCVKSGAAPLSRSPAACAGVGEAGDLVVMLENPAEELPQNEVEKYFSGHGLRLWWAPADVEPRDLPRETVVVVTVQKRVGKSMLHMLPRLQLVAVGLTGVDHIDIEECKRKGVAVANVPDYSTASAAEMCFGLLFSLLRHIPRAHKHIRGGQWVWPPGSELSGKRVGILGTGKLGNRLAEISKVFRVSQILGYDAEPNEDFRRLGGKYQASMATLFLHSDIVFISCALNPQTYGMVNAKLLRLLRPDSILINCARGGIVDQEALAKMLQEKRFRAGLDVFGGGVLGEVNLPQESIFRSLPEEQLVTTPHIGYKTHEALKRRTELVKFNILAFLAGSPQNIVEHQ